MKAFIPKNSCIVHKNIDATATLEAIIKSANTGKIGDGKIFVATLEQIIRIRTGESGEEAI